MPFRFAQGDRPIEHAPGLPAAPPARRPAYFPFISNPERGMAELLDRLTELQRRVTELRDFL